MSIPPWRRPLDERRGPLAQGERFPPPPLPLVPHSASQPPVEEGRSEVPWRRVSEETRKEPGLIARAVASCWLKSLSFQLGNPCEGGDETLGHRLEPEDSVPQRVDRVHDSTLVVHRPRRFIGHDANVACVEVTCPVTCVRVVVEVVDRSRNERIECFVSIRPLDDVPLVLAQRGSGSPVGFSRGPTGGELFTA